MALPTYLCALDVLGGKLPFGLCENLRARLIARTMPDAASPSSPASYRHGHCGKCEYPIDHKTNGLCPECGTVTTDPMILYRAYLPGAKSERLWIWLRRPIAIGLTPFILAVAAATIFVAIYELLGVTGGSGGNSGNTGGVRTHATNPTTESRELAEQIYGITNVGWMLGSPGLMLLLSVFTLTRKHPIYTLPHFRIGSTLPSSPKRPGAAITLFVFITLLICALSWFCGLAVYLLVTVHIIGID